MDLVPFDTRVLLFHSPNARQDSGTAMEDVNVWLGKDRARGPYANLRIQQITVTPDGVTGVFVAIVCARGRESGMPTALQSTPSTTADG